MCRMFFILPLMFALLLVRTSNTAGYSDAMVLGACKPTIPTEVAGLLRAKLPLWKIVGLSDLRSDDQKIWQQKFTDECPGIVIGRFSANEPAYAITLIRHQNHVLYQTLVVAEKKAGAYELITLDSPKKTAVISVVRKLPPGSYSSPGASKEVRIECEGISYETIEAGAILYYFSKDRYKRLVISE